MMDEPAHFTFDLETRTDSGLQTQWRYYISNRQRTGSNYRNSLSFRALMSLSETVAGFKSGHVATAIFAGEVTEKVSSAV